MYNLNCRYKVEKFTPCKGIEGRICTYVGEDSGDNQYADYYKFKLEEPYDVPGNNEDPIEFIYKIIGGGFGETKFVEAWEGQQVIEKNYNI